MSARDDQTNKRLVGTLIAASGALMLLGAIGVFAFGGNAILGGALAVAGVADLGVAIFIRSRG